MIRKKSKNISKKKPSRKRSNPLSSDIYTMLVIDRSKLSKLFPEIDDDLEEYIDENDITFGDGEYYLIPLKRITSLSELKDICVNIEA